MKWINDLKKFKDYILKPIIENNKLIYEGLSVIYIIFLLISVARFYSGIGILVLLIPIFILSIGSFIITPILLAKEHQAFKINQDTFYLTFAFWFLISIIYFIWKW